MKTRISRGIIALLACIAIAGCGVVKSDDPLESKLSELKANGQSAPLSELTDFSWDEVHLFNEHTRREAIEKIVGSPVISAGTHQSGSLLVFEDRGAVVKTVTVGGDYLRADGYTFGSDVLIEPWGNGAMRLTPPAADSKP
ncbi:hypothetical protein M1247_10275 [Mycobacterium sp. 21AC1]|uniref:hypothetical protein n=1 Tax=[Mycobacterium] appelbergii TaxID=2939269 RepID=UPI002938EB44|nr:hypothetical protein [Mycobacterium sp. 21AC1]MDV3125297.1 hypothetical protein [Mycobacterium sp. 21AC1]